MTSSERVGIYPGSFNPPTTAHLAVSEAARSKHRLDRVVWSISRVALAKEDVDHPRFEHRLEVLHAVAAELPWLHIETTTAKLIVDIARGFDVLIMGADKWAQINEPHWYGSEMARDAAMSALPDLAVAPRPPHDVPARLVLRTEEHHHDVSSSKARAGAIGLMLPPASSFADLSGAWLDPDRYERWASSR